MSSISSLLAISGISFRNTLVYRFNFVFYTIGTLLQLLLMLAVWMALDAQGSLTGNLSFKTMATYSALAFSLNIAFSVFYIYGYLTELIRKGDLAMELVRPLHFMANLLFRFFGFTIFRAGFLAIPFSILFGLILGIELPPDVPTGFFFALSVLMAYLINYFIFFLFALLTFVSLDNSGIMLMFMSVSSLFSGLYLPFWIFPDWLRGVAEILPFKGVYYTPISLYMGTLPAVDALGFQAAWLGGLILVAWGCRQKSMVRRIVVQGADMNSLDHYLELARLSLKTRIGYRFDFVVGAVGVILSNVINIGLILIITLRFDTLFGWNFWELVFMYNIWLFTHGFYSTFFRNVKICRPWWSAAILTNSL